ncbi:MAG: flagellar basal body rod protein FlgB [Pseudomonadota bacterium]
MQIDSFSPHEQALSFRARRNEVLSANIANADTPNYKARDLDFQDVLNAASRPSSSLRTTHATHISTGPAGVANGDLKYRIPVQPTLDGNTVETDIEQTAYAENALHYRAALAFVDGQIRTLKFAIKGGE